MLCLHTTTTFSIFMWAILYAFRVLYLDHSYTIVHDLAAYSVSSEVTFMAFFSLKLGNI